MIKRFSAVYSSMILGQNVIEICILASWEQVDRARGSPNENHLRKAQILTEYRMSNERLDRFRITRLVFCLADQRF